MAPRRWNPARSAPPAPPGAVSASPPAAAIVRAPPRSRPGVPGRRHHQPPSRRHPRRLRCPRALGLPRPARAAGRAAAAAAADRPRLRRGRAAGAALLLSGGASFPAGAALGFACAAGAALTWALYSVLAGTARFAAVPTEAVAGFCLASAALALAAHL